MNVYHAIVESSIFNSSIESILYRTFNILFAIESNAKYYYMYLHTYESLKTIKN